MYTQTQEFQNFVIAMIQQNPAFCRLMAECNTKEEMAQKAAIAFSVMRNK